LREALSFAQLLFCSRALLAAEVLFLRKQLAFYQEREIKPRRFDDAARISLLVLGKLFDGKDALVNVKPGTFIAWHRKDLSPVLSLEVSWRETTVAERHSAIDCGDGKQQSDLGAGARICPWLRTRQNRELWRSGSKAGLYPFLKSAACTIATDGRPLRHNPNKYDLRVSSGARLSPNLKLFATPPLFTPLCCPVAGHTVPRM